MRRLALSLLIGLTAASGALAAEAGISVNVVQRQKTPVTILHGDGTALVVWENTRLGVLSRVVPVENPASATAPERILLANTHVPSVPGRGEVYTHREPALLRNADGGFWLFWTRERAFLRVEPFYENRQVLALEIRRRRFDRNGEPMGSEMPVARGTGLQSQPRVERLADGGMAVIWRSDDRDKDSHAGDGIFARYFGAAGELRGGPFRVNDVSDGDQASWPSLASDGAGRVLALWQAPDGDTLGVYRRLLDADGSTLAGVERLNLTTAGRQTQPVAIARPEGGFLVLWQGAMGVRLQTRIFLRQLDDAARPIGGERVISEGPLEYEMGPAIVATQRGTYFAAWSLWDTSFPRAMRGIELQADGATVGEERNLNSFRLNPVYRAVLASSPSDGVFALWEGFPVRRGKGAIVARPLDFLD